ncbi:hypothetical protein AC20117_22215 (plasmid) [Arthrobacter crystallopoietes]|nr:hypothetical protein AC20117_22215 [Arthrobacter crystallopoietes]
MGSGDGTDGFGRHELWCDFVDDGDQTFVGVSNLLRQELDTCSQPLFLSEFADDSDVVRVGVGIDATSTFQPVIVIIICPFSSWRDYGSARVPYSVKLERYQGVTASPLDRVGRGSGIQ